MAEKKKEIEKTIRGGNRVLINVFIFRYMEINTTMAAENFEDVNTSNTVRLRRGFNYENTHPYIEDDLWQGMNSDFAQTCRISRCFFVSSWHLNSSIISTRKVGTERTL